MTDVAPILHEAIKKAFDAGIKNDKTVTKLMAKLKDGTATYRDVAKYADKVGGYTSKALQGALTASALPDGHLYYNIATRTVQPALENAQDLIDEMSKVAQTNANAKAKIGIRPIMPEHNDRIAGLIDAMTEAEEFDETLLDEPVKNLARARVDDFQKANADFHKKAGLETVVIREYDGRGLHNGTEACEWCLAREGEWSYDDAIANGVFERHDGCGCTIEVVTRKR